MEYCVEPSEISQRLAKQPVTIRDGYAHLPTSRAWAWSRTRR